MTASDDDRIAYLAGDAVDSLDASERAQLDELREALREPATWVEPDASLEDRIVDAISAEAPARPVRERRRGGFFNRPAWVLGAAAAAVAAVVAVIVIASNGGPAASKQFAMAVSGTPLAPGVHGSARLTKTASGWRIELSVPGLPQLSNGRYYQGWLKNAAGILVPVGTFNDARKVTLWSGVPVTQFRTLTVTEQQANGNPSSSGRRVLVGTIRPPR